MKLKCKKLTSTATLPQYATSGSAGLDLFASRDCVIDGTLVTTVPTGIAVEIPEGYEGQIRPRSSLSKRLLDVVLGTIDSDYRGELGIRVLDISGGREEEEIIREGERIAQLVICPVARVELEVVPELSETLRGTGGFGSTGQLELNLNPLDPKEVLRDLHQVLADSAHNRGNPYRIRTLSNCGISSFTFSKFKKGTQELGHNFEVQTTNVGAVILVRKDGHFCGTTYFKGPDMCINMLSFLANYS